MTKTEIFIQKSKLIHNDKYDYALVEYTGNKNPVKIICPVHNIFEIRPDSHIMGRGCKQCLIRKKRVHMKNKETFLKIANMKHGNTYDYSLVNFINSETKVKIICPVHNIFEQKPSSHKKYGCIKCGGREKQNTETFIKKGNKVHNFYYNYDKVEYVNWETKVNITCPKHGEFLQNPEHHFKGHGCPTCKLSKGELEIENYLKQNNINYKPQFSFENLKYKDVLHFDFGILDDNGNLNQLIEYNGKQHYKFIEFFHKTEERYEEAKLRDQMKIDYCKHNNISLHIIRYDEDILEKINGIL